jgi:hypothetical protein
MRLPGRGLSVRAVASRAATNLPGLRNSLRSMSTPSSIIAIVVP